MPDQQFKIKILITSSFEHVMEVHPHWHDEVEILYVSNGTAIQQVNDRFFPIVPGDLVVISSGQLHSTYSNQGSKCDIFVLLFDASSVLDKFELVGKQTPSCSFNNSILFNNPIKTVNEPEKQLLDCLLQIRKELVIRERAYDHCIKSLLYKMLVVLERNDLYKINKNDYRKNVIIRQMLEKTFNLIDASYFEDVSLKKAAAVSNLSVQHFCRLFKKTTGMTFNDYLSFYRVNRAEKLLHSQKKITEIALECGFGSMSSFIRNFKKYKNCTPSGYKNL
ncbi:MAG TPA: AraC family transcriptional regulator [Ruminiclostridium sp.]